MREEPPRTGAVAPVRSSPPSGGDLPLTAGERVMPFDDMDAAFYTVGQVCGMLGVQPPFLRRLDFEEIVQPARSEGRHRRYSRQQIVEIEHVLRLTGEGLTLAAVRRILLLEAQIRALRQQIAELEAVAPATEHTT